MSRREEDVAKEMFVVNSHDLILFFTDKGKVFKMKGYEIPEASRTAKGTPVINFLNLDSGERVTAIIPMRDYNEDDYLVMATLKGTIKKTPIDQFENIRNNGLIAINLKEDDRLIGVSDARGNENIYIVTKMGKAIAFSGDEVRSIGRTAAGVRAINLEDDDEVVAMELDDGTSKARMFVLTENGYGKRTSLDEYRLQSRGGKGVMTYDKTKFEKTGYIVGAALVTTDDEIMIINSSGVIIRIRAKEVSTSGRTTQGVKIMKVDEDDRIVSFAKVVDRDSDDDDDSESADDPQQTLF